jgi:O-antigen ligase
MMRGYLAPSRLNTIKLLGFLTAIVGTGFSIFLCGLGIAIYGFGWILERVFGVKCPYPRYPYPVLLTVLIASLLVSLFISDYFATSLRGFWKYLEGFILLYAGIDVCAERKNCRWILSALVFSYFVVSLDGIYQNFFGVDFIRGREANIYQGDILRLTGPFKHCNDYASFLVPGFLIATALFLKSISEKKKALVFLWVALFALLGYNLWATLSRSALLSVFAAFFCFALFFRVRWIAIGGIGVILTVLWFVPSDLSQRLQGLLDPASGTSERLLLFKTALKMINENPWFGLGLNTYSKYFPQFKPADYPAFMYAHNGYLQMATEIGWVGISLYVSFISSLLFSSIRGIFSRPPSFDRTLAAAIVCGVIGLLINALFESLFQSTQLRAYFWSLLGIVCGLTGMMSRVLVRP